MEALYIEVAQLGQHLNSVKEEAVVNICSASGILKMIIQKMSKCLWKIAREQWKKAKEYQIKIGKHGNFIKMINPKVMQNPVANSTFPTVPEDPIWFACNREEQKEATNQMHTWWMEDPLRNVNCHFFTSVTDETGPQGVFVDMEKEFDAQAQFSYLDGVGAEKIIVAHKKVRKLARLFQDDTHLIISFLV